ncbi:uncharacterized protein LOC135835553 [Planococcus citri]|uniref:uncharacterized protein LOC135835553 n=1 Tax=Planococcus citri TaxID=170843 RepID=UPI0031F9430B
MYWTYAIFFLFISSVTAGESSNVPATNTELIQKYKQEICQLKDTCDVIKEIPPTLQDLRTRNCMCDDKCHYYKDCCRDTNRTEDDIGVQFLCTKTPFDGDVYMIQSCPKEWNVTSIKENCLAQNPVTLSYDILLKLPVTSTSNGVTYGNVFCAICHEETKYDFWNVGFTYEFINVSSTSLNSDDRSIDVKDILDNLSFNETGEMIWSSQVKESFYRCNLQAKLPSRITSLRYCVPDVIRSCANGTICEGYSSYVYIGDTVYKNSECAECNDIKSNELKGCSQTTKISDENVTEILITDSSVPKVPHCDDFPVDTPAQNLICKKQDHTPEETSTEECYFLQKSKKPFCYINKFYHLTNQEFYYVNNETVFVKEYDWEFPEYEWAALNNTTIYVCGRQIPKTRYQRIMDYINDLITEILIKISIVCVVLHLLAFWQLPELRNLSGKNLASFCVALLAAFLSYDIGPWLPSCETLAILTHYSFLSCFAWMLIMSYDVWFTLYRATSQSRTSAGNHRITFLIYSILAWTLPLCVVGPAVYVEFAPSNVVSCDLKPAYGKFDQCFIAQKMPFIYFFFIPATTIFFINICFFAHTAYRKLG